MREGILIDMTHTVTLKHTPLVADDQTLYIPYVALCPTGPKDMNITTLTLFLVF